MGAVLLFLLPHYSAAELSRSILVTDTEHLLIADAMHVLIVFPLSLGEIRTEAFNQPPVSNVTDCCRIDLLLPLCFGSMVTRG